MKIDDKVRINKTKQIGYVSDLRNEKVVVRIPGMDGWPFPSYVHTHTDQITVLRKIKDKPNVDDVEEALF
jgi:hypothetical protein